MSNSNNNNQDYTEKYIHWKQEEMEKHYENNKSVKQKLQNEGKTDKQFEYKVSQLTLEELIALKLELMYEALDGKFFGFTLWSRSKDIMKDGITRFAMSVTDSMQEASEFIGIRRRTFYRFVNKHNLNDFFEDG